MNPILAAIIIAGTLAALSIPEPSAADGPPRGFFAADGAHCGRERWQIKSATDPGLDLDKLTYARTTIAELVALPAPPDLNSRPDTRWEPVETTVYSLDATLIMIRPEKDSDYHAVIRDDAGNTMIIESPDPACAQGSVVYRQISEVRQLIDAYFGGPVTRKIDGLNVPVSVTGSAMFDVPHGQSGGATNSIEIHPIWSLVFRDGGHR